MTIDLRRLVDPLCDVEFDKRPQLPVLAAARFEAQNESAAKLIISGNNAANVYLTIIHEGRQSQPVQVIEGHKVSKPITVRDAESVLILARFEGALVASAMLQVDMRLPESIGMLMNPKSTADIIVEQFQTKPSGGDSQLLSEAVASWVTIPGIFEEINADLEQTVLTQAVRPGRKEVEVAR